MNAVKVDTLDIMRIDTVAAQCLLSAGRDGMGYKLH